MKLLYQPSKRKYYQFAKIQSSLTYYKVNMGQLETIQKTQNEKSIISFSSIFLQLEQENRNFFNHQIQDFPIPSFSENSSQKSFYQDFQETVCNQSKVRPTWDTWDDGFNSSEQYQSSRQINQFDWEQKNEFGSMDIQE